VDVGGLRGGGLGAVAGPGGHAHLCGRALRAGAPHVFRRRRPLQQPGEPAVAGGQQARGERGLAGDRSRHPLRLQRLDGDPPGRAGGRQAGRADDCDHRRAGPDRPAGRGDAGVPAPDPVGQRGFRGAVRLHARAAVRQDLRQRPVLRRPRRAVDHRRQRGADPGLPAGGLRLQRLAAGFGGGAELREQVSDEPPDRALRAVRPGGAGDAEQRARRAGASGGSHPGAHAHHAGLGRGQPAHAGAGVAPDGPVGRLVGLR